jgi:hypothetical protein
VLQNFTINAVDILVIDLYADDLLKQCPSKGDKYVINEELQHTDHLFLGVAGFTFLNLFEKYVE